jgi:hypothetical protein
VNRAPQGWEKSRRRSQEANATSRSDRAMARDVYDNENDVHVRPAAGACRARALPLMGPLVVRLAGGLGPRRAKAMPHTPPASPPEIRRPQPLRSTAPQPCSVVHFPARTRLGAWRLS